MDGFSSDYSRSIKGPQVPLYFPIAAAHAAGTAAPLSGLNRFAECAAKISFSNAILVAFFSSWCSVGSESNSNKQPPLPQCATLLSPSQLVVALGNEGPNES